MDGTNAYKRQNSLIQWLLRKDKEQQTNEVCLSIESSAITNSTRDLYQEVKKLARRLIPRIGVIKDENKEALSEGSKIMEKILRRTAQ